MPHLLLRSGAAAFAATCAVLAVTASGCSSTATSESPPRTYTTFAEQVTHGATLYGMHCAKCHGDGGEGDDAPRVVGLAQGALPLDPPPTAKARKTRFVTVADVADFVVKYMPPKKAGTLPTEDYLAILAFDLKANGIDLGQEKLTLAKARQLVIPR